MKAKITKLMTLLLLISASVHAQIETPRPSPAGSVSSVVGLTEFKIEYFRPKKNDRMIFGSGDEFLLQYGEMWRTGANSGTKLSLSTDAKIAGKDVKSGTYLILTIPGEDEWRFILYSDISLGGNMAGFKKEHEVINVGLKPMMLSKPVETLTFQISDISEDNTMANIHFSWDNTALKVPVEVDYDAAVMESIAKNTTVNPNNYAAAASYYLETNKDLEQALEWINNYLSVGNNTDHFWHLHTKARILAAMGNKKEAKEVAKESMMKAENNPNGDFGYIKRNKDLISSL